MTIEAKKWLGGAALALAGWSAIMVAMPFFGPAGRQVAVVGSKAGTISAIRAAGGTIVEIREGATLARSDERWFPLALYRQGAALVLEGRIGAGCFKRAGDQA